MLVIVQVVGALLVLLPFVAQQLGKLAGDAYGYLWPNLIGSTVLAVLASIGGQWGFLLLEGAWATVSARSILRRRLAPV
jgi:protein-S-isoprenylcysteine O-methyltransferase Ste14